MVTIIHITPKSSNKKTGPIPVTTTSRNTCPPSCSWYDKGCYAKFGPLGLHWDKVTANERGGSWKAFLEWLKNLPDDMLWRHNQAGDLPGEGEDIDKAETRRMFTIGKHTMGFTYTHKWKGNTRFVNAMNHIGKMVLNTSCDSVEDARKSFEAGMPTTMVLPENWEEIDLPIAQCPGELGRTCLECKLCARANRKVIVGFTPHGTQSNYVRSVANG